MNPIRGEETHCAGFLCCWRNKNNNWQTKQLINNIISWSIGIKNAVIVIPIRYWVLPLLENMTTNYLEIIND